MSLTTEPSSSRWFGRNKSKFIIEFGREFWEPFVDELGKVDSVRDLPEKYRKAVAKVKKAS